MESPISDDVLRFIAAHIRSLEQLEILLLVAGKPVDAWTVDSVYQVIRSSQASVAERLDDLSAQGLIQTSATTPTTYRFQPKVQGATEAIAALAIAYKERRVKIVEFIYSQPSDPVRSFAEAFKFRKDK